MSNIIVTTEEALRAIIAEAVAGAIPQTAPVAPPPDTIALPAAQQLLADHGYPTSRAKIYKLTSSGSLPYRKYGNKLVFSRRELLAWAESQTRTVGDHSDAILAIARSARRKR
jgi:hypothetical protein